MILTNLLVQEKSQLVCQFSREFTETLEFDGEFVSLTVANYLLDCSFATQFSWGYKPYNHM